MGCALGWLSNLWTLSVTDKDGEDVRRLREQRLGDKVIKRVNKFVANAFSGFMAQCAMGTPTGTSNRTWRGNCCQAQVRSVPGLVQFTAL